MNSFVFLWVALIVVSTLFGLIFSQVGSHSDHLRKVISGVLACITVSSIAAIQLVTSHALGTL